MEAEVRAPAPEGLQRRETQRGFELVHRHGKAEIEDVAKGLTWIRYEGVATTEMAEQITRHLDDRIKASGAVSIAADAKALRSYEPGFRKTFANWFRTHSGRIHAVLMLFDSKIVQMGVQLVNPLIGGRITSYSNRGVFERAVAELERHHGR
jgi:hypothetical protein